VATYKRDKAKEIKMLKNTPILVLKIDIKTKKDNKLPKPLGKFFIRV